MVLTTNAPQVRDILHHAWPHAAHQNNYIRRLLHAKRCSPCAAHCYYARQNVLIMCSPTRQIKGWHRAKWAQLCLLRTSSAHWGCSCPLYSTHKKTITVTLCADTACYYYTPWINGRVPRTKTTRETVLTTRQKVLTIGAVRSLHAPNGAPESGIFISQDHDPSKPFFRSTFDARMLHFPSEKTMMRTWMHLWKFWPVLLTNPARKWRQQKKKQMSFGRVVVR